MSRLRDDLRLAANAYRQVTYPGYLPGELLQSVFSLRSRLFIGAIAGSAVAASVALGVLLMRPAAMPSHGRPTLPLVQDIQFPRSMPFELPAMPRLTPHMSLREMAPSLVPAEGMHLPSFEDLKRSIMSSDPGRA